MTYPPDEPYYDDDFDSYTTFKKNYIEEYKENTLMTKTVAQREVLTEVSSTVTSPKLIIPNKQPEKELFMSIKPSRVANQHGCLQVSIKAPLFEEFFTGLSPDRENLKKENPEYNKFCLVLGRAKKPDGSPIYLTRINTPIANMTGKATDGFLLSDYLTPNMILLTAVGLKDGVDFIFSDMYTKETIEEALNRFYKNAKMIFKNYIKPIEMEFEIHIKEVS